MSQPVDEEFLLRENLEFASAIRDHGGMSQATGAEIIQRGAERDLEKCFGENSPLDKVWRDDGGFILRFFPLGFLYRVSGDKLSEGCMEWLESQV